MSVPRPVDVLPEPRCGPSAADIASRVAAADPVAAAQAESRIRAHAFAKQQASSEAAKERANAANEDSPPKPTKDLGFAVVKAVNSADSVVLMGSSPVNGGRAPEKSLTLTGLSAPRPARKDGQEDEPFAFESREFLRKLVIGKRVRFAVTYVHESSGREYGTMELDGEDVASAVVAAGWASVKVPPKSKDGKIPADREALVQLEAAAKDKKIGIHADDKSNAKRILNYVSGKSAQGLFREIRDKTLTGVVEHVREGSTMRLELPVKNSKGQTVHHIIVMHLAGAQCPRVPIPYKGRLAAWERNKTGPKPEPEEPEPFANEALAFCEKNLLHRDVTVRVQGCDKGNNLFGSIRVPQGDVATALLQCGLAKFVGWSAAFSGQKEELEAAEAAAQAARACLWRGLTQENDAASAAQRSFVGKVVQVVSSDTLVVAEVDGSESRVHLSSVKCPRSAIRSRAGEPWAAEGQEFMRKRLVGRKVRVVVDYVRKSPKEATDRVFATVFSGNNNVAVWLLQEGFGEVVHHRVDDPRSTHYDDLIEAEAQAEKKKKGLKSGNDPVAHAVIDLTVRARGDQESEKLAREASVKSRQFLPFMQKSKRVKGIVEHVIHANRLKVRVPSQNCILAFVLAGVRSPSSRDNVEEFSEEATAFVRNRVLQHDVELEVETLDRGDNFVGSLWIDRKNLSVLLLDRGLARVVPYSAERSPYAEELFTAEKVAKQGKVGIWHSWDEEKFRAEQEAARAARRAEAAADASSQLQAQTLSVTVSEVFDATDFYVLETDSKTSEEVENAVAASVSSPVVGSISGKRGELCLGKFSDGNWYRCKIEKREDDDLYSVSFIDFGNMASLKSAELRPPSPNSETLRLPALAKRCALTGVKLSRDYQDESMDAFMGMVSDRRFKCVVDDVDPTSHKLMVTLTYSDVADEKESNDNTLRSINSEMLRIGMARIPSRPLRSLKKQIERLRKDEEHAKQTFSGLWEYGDVSSDEDEEVDQKKVRR